MKSKLLSNIEGRREWALIFDAKDEVMGKLIVIESPVYLRKSFRKEFGLALIDLDRN